MLTLKNCFALGIVLLFATGFCFSNSNILPPSPPKILWKDAFKLTHRNTELLLQTSGVHDCWPGLKWNVTIKVKIPCSKEMFEELSPVKDDKSFRLFDQLHNAILFNERERIISSDHALGHLLGTQNSDILSTKFDFKNFGWTQTRTLDTWYDPNEIVALETSDGEIHNMNIMKSAKYFQRALDPSTLPEEIEGSIPPIQDIVSTFTRMKKIDLPEAHPLLSEIDFLKTQLKTGVFLSVKVISESEVDGIRYTFEKSDGSREGCTYKFDSNLHIDSKSNSEAGYCENSTHKERFYTQDSSHNKPMITRIPKAGKPNSPWYSSFTSLFSTPEIDHLCLTYYGREVKGDGDVPLRKAILSFLICY